MGSERLTIAVGLGLCLGVLIATVSLASRTLSPVLAVAGAIPPAAITALSAYPVSSGRPGLSP